MFIVTGCSTLGTTGAGVDIGDSAGCESVQLKAGFVLNAAFGSFPVTALTPALIASSGTDDVVFVVLSPVGIFY